MKSHALQHIQQAWARFPGRSGGDCHLPARASTNPDALHRVDIGACSRLPAPPLGHPLTVRPLIVQFPHYGCSPRRLFMEYPRTGQPCLPHDRGAGKRCEICRVRPCRSPVRILPRCPNCPGAASRCACPFQRLKLAHHRNLPCVWRPDPKARSRPAHPWSSGARPAFRTYGSGCLR